MFSIPFNKASGLNDMLSIPFSTRNCTNSGKSLGAWPQRPIFVADFFALSITMLIIILAAAFCSLNKPATNVESLSIFAIKVRPDKISFEEGRSIFNFGKNYNHGAILIFARDKYKC